MSIIERAIDKLEQEKSGRKKGRSLEGITQHSPERSSTQSVVNSGPAVDLEPALLTKAGLTPPSELSLRIAEEFRIIKRPLLANIAAEGEVRVPQGNLIMVTSSLPGAGKTFTAFNLALSMAVEMDWMVLLVDADVTKRQITSSLGLSNVPGLIDLLSGEAHAFSELVALTTNPRLQILPAGRRDPNATELLGSQRMSSLVAEMGGRYEDRLIIFDSPPLLVTSQARVLASHMGQILLVVEAGVTTRSSVLNAIETLDQSKAVNLVLNKSRRQFGGEYDGGGYDSYYGDGN